MSIKRFLGGIIAEVLAPFADHWHRQGIQRLELEDQLARDRLDLLDRQARERLEVGLKDVPKASEEPAEPRKSAKDSPLAKRLTALGFTVNEDCFEKTVAPERLGELHLCPVHVGNDEAEECLRCSHCEIAGWTLIEVVMDGEWTAHEAPVDDADIGVVCPKCGLVIAVASGAPSNGVFAPLMRLGTSLLDVLKEPDGTDRNPVLLAALDRRLGRQQEVLLLRLRSISAARDHLREAPASETATVGTLHVLPSARAHESSGSAGRSDDDPPAAS